AAFSFLVGLNDDADNQSLTSLAIMSIVAMAVMNLPVNFMKLVFPVSDRQIAYISLAVWAVLFSVGGIAWGLGMAINARPGEVDLVVAVTALLLTIILLLLISRLFSCSVFVVAYLFSPLILLTYNDRQLYNYALFLSENGAMMPLALLVIAFLLWEAP